jgi:serine/threonine protein kinase
VLVERRGDNYLCFETWGGRIQRRPAFLAKQVVLPSNSNSNSSSKIESNDNNDEKSDAVAKVRAHRRSASSSLSSSAKLTSASAKANSSSSLDVFGAKNHTLEVLNKVAHGQLGKHNVAQLVDFAVASGGGRGGGARFAIMPLYFANFADISSRQVQHRYSGYWELVSLRALFNVFVALRFMHAHRFVHGAVDFQHVLVDESQQNAVLKTSSLSFQVAERRLQPEGALVSSRAERLLEHHRPSLAAAKRAGSAAAASQPLAATPMPVGVGPREAYLPPEASKMATIAMLKFPLHSFDIWSVAIAAIEMLSGEDLSSKHCQMAFAEATKALRDSAAAASSSSGPAAAASPARMIDGVLLSPRSRLSRKMFGTVERIDAKLTHYPHWPQFADLLRRMLAFDPSEREPAHRLLAHPIFHEMLMGDPALFHAVHAPLMLSLTLGEKQKHILKRRSSSVSSLQVKKDGRAQRMIDELRKLLAKPLGTLRKGVVRQEDGGASLSPDVLQLASSTLTAFLGNVGSAQRRPVSTSRLSALRQRFTVRAAEPAVSSTPMFAGRKHSKTVASSKSPTPQSTSPSPSPSPPCVWSLLLDGELLAFANRLLCEGAPLSPAHSTAAGTGLVCFDVHQIPRDQDFLTECAHRHRIRAIGTGVLSIDGRDIAAPRSISNDLDQSEHDDKQDKESAASWIKTEPSSSSLEVVSITSHREAKEDNGGKVEIQKDEDEVDVVDAVEVQEEDKGNVEIQKDEDEVDVVDAVEVQEEDKGNVEIQKDEDKVDVVDAVEVQEEDKDNVEIQKDEDKVDVVDAVEVQEEDKDNVEIQKDEDEVVEIQVSASERRRLIRERRAKMKALRSTVNDAEDVLADVQSALRRLKRESKQVRAEAADESARLERHLRAEQAEQLREEQRGGGLTLARIVCLILAVSQDRTIYGALLGGVVSADQRALCETLVDELLVLVENESAAAACCDMTLAVQLLVAAMEVWHATMACCGARDGLLPLLLCGGGGECPLFASLQRRLASCYELAGFVTQLGIAEPIAVPEADALPSDDAVLTDFVANVIKAGRQPLIDALPSLAEYVKSPASTVAAATATTATATTAARAAADADDAPPPPCSIAAHFLTSADDVTLLDGDNAGALVHGKGASLASYCGQQCVAVRCTRDDVALLAKIRCGNIVPLLAAVVDDGSGTATAVLDYAPAALSSLLAVDSAALSSPVTCMRVAIRLAVGLNYLHSTCKPPLAHGALDAGAVWLSSSGGGTKLCVRDACAARSGSPLDDVARFADIVAQLDERCGGASAELAKLRQLCLAPLTVSAQALVEYLRESGLLINRFERESDEIEDTLEKIDALERAVDIRQRLLDPVLQRWQLLQIRLAKSSIGANKSPESGADEQAKSGDAAAALAALKDGVESRRAQLDECLSEARQLSSVAREQQRSDRRQHSKALRDIEDEEGELDAQYGDERRALNALRRQVRQLTDDFDLASLQKK